MVLRMVLAQGRTRALCLAEEGGREVGKHFPFSLSSPGRAAHLLPIDGLLCLLPSLGLQTKRGCSITTSSKKHF